MPPPKWATLLTEYRQENPRNAGRLDLHDIDSIAATDTGLCAFPEEVVYVKPKKDRNEDLFIYGSNTGEKTTIEVYFKRRPMPVVGRFGLPKDDVEVKLIIRDDRGDTYLLEERTTVHFNEHEYRACGFAYEALQGNKIGRIKFRGYLKRNDESKLVYVQIRFLCLYFSKLFDHQRFFDDQFLLKQLKGAKSKVKSIGDLLEDKMEQFCQIKGTFKVEDYNEQELFFIGTVGRRFATIREVPPRKVVKLCGFAVDGIGFQIGLVTQGTASYFYGFASLRGENFKVLRKISISKEKFAGLAKTTELVQFAVKLDNKDSWIEVLPYKGQSRLVTFNGVDGMGFVDERVLDGMDGQVNTVPIGDELKDTLAVSLSDNCATVTELTGGKGASLAHLSKMSEGAKWTVPNAVVVTTSAYRVQTEAMEGFESKLKELEANVVNRKDVEKSCQDFVAWFMTHKLNEKIENELMKSIGLEFGSVKFAVRSSAATEDSNEMSAAGQMTTYLGVKSLDAVSRAVVACWASQFAFVPVEYKRGYGQPLNSPMAVVVQQMVDCTSAGVIFTASPTDGDERVITVTSNFGLGESVVSAAAEPDTFTLAVKIEANSYQVERKITEITSKVLGQKRLVTRLSRDVGMGFENGIINEEMEDGVQQQSLDDADLLKLGDTALQIAARSGRPCDLEWGIRNGQLFLFQSRPITNLDSTFTTYELIHELDSAHMCEFEIYTRNHWGEILPGSISWMGAFCVSTEFLLVREQIKQGASTSADYNPYRPLLGVYANQVMFSMKNTFVQALFNRYPQSDIIVALVFALFGHRITDDDVLETFRTSRHTMQTTVQQKLKIASMAWSMLLTAHKKIPQLKHEVVEQNRGDIAGPMQSLPLGKKMRFTLERAALNLEDGRYHNATLLGSALKSMMLRKALKKDDNAALLESDHNLLLSHCNDVVSVEIPNMLRDIAKAVWDKEDFVDLSDEEALGALQCAGDSKAAELFENFLSKHGHRGHREVDPLFLPMRQNPITAVQVIKSLLNSNMSLDPKPTKSTVELLDELQTPVSPFKRCLIKNWFLPWCRDAVGYRENTKSILMMHQNQTREAFWQIASDMHQKGMLPEVELFFYLKFDEATQIIAGERNPLFIWKAKQRRRLFPTMDLYRFDEFIKGFRMAPRPTRKEKFLSDDMVSLKGTAVTVGEVKARVCVAQTIADAAQIEPGDILITYSTDIGWSPYFPLISGIVTEIGGTISHGAVIAREYGIPCLIAVANVCNRFQTGDIAYLDCKRRSIVKVKE